MTKGTDKAADTEKLSMPAPYPGLAAFNGDLFGAYIQASQSFFENVFALNQEIMRFASERLQADIEAIQGLPQCTDWEHTIEFQSGFVQMAVEAYQAEIAKLMEQFAQTTTTAWEPFHKSATALKKDLTKA